MPTNKIVCAWCQSVLKEGHEPVSHGICEKCKTELEEEMSQPGCKIDWEDLAWDHGFRGNDKAMFLQWYHGDRLSMEEIGRKIDICATTISRRIRDLGIKILPPRNKNCGRGPRIK